MPYSIYQYKNLIRQGPCTWPQLPLYRCKLYFLCRIPSSWDLSCWLVFFRWSISSACAFSSACLRSIAFFSTIWHCTCRSLTCHVQRKHHKCFNMQLSTYNLLLCLAWPSPAPASGCMSPSLLSLPRPSELSWSQTRCWTHRGPDSHLHCKDSESMSMR